jgi:hypothetical protein
MHMSELRTLTEVEVELVAGGAFSSSGHNGNGNGHNGNEAINVATINGQNGFNAGFNTALTLKL